MASFVSDRALAPQAHLLLAAVGEQMAGRVSLTEDSVWLSTSGLGVYWLHVRLDSRPKYYTYEPYKRQAGKIGV